MSEPSVRPVSLSQPALTTALAPAPVLPASPSGGRLRIAAGVGPVEARLADAKRLASSLH